MGIWVRRIWGGLGDGVEGNLCKEDMRGGVGNGVEGNLDKEDMRGGARFWGLLYGCAG